MSFSRHVRGTGAITVTALVWMALRASNAASDPASATDQLRGRIWQGERAIAEALVRLYADRGRLAAETTTDAGGRFAMSALTAGRYSLAVTAPGGSQGLRGVVVADGRVTDLGGIHLRSRGVRLRGRAWDAHGRVAADARVVLTDWGGAGTPDPPLVFESTAGADGRYELRVPPGYYSIEASVVGLARAPRLWLHLGGDQERDLVLQPSCTLTGRAVDRTGTPVGAASIVAHQAGAGRSLTATAATDGAFLLQDVAPGLYDLVGRSGVLAGLTRRVAVACTSEDPSVALVFDKGATLKVRVRDVSGEVPAELRATLVRRDAPTDVRRADAVTDGAWELNGVAVGEYHLVVEAPGYASSRQPMSVPVPGMGMQGEVTLAREAVMTGRAAAADGTPVAGARIRVMVLAADAADDPSEAFAMTDPEGRYELRGLPSGTAVVTASADARGVAQAIRPDLEAGGSHTVDLTLSRPSTVSGRIRRPDGKPIAGARVESLPPETDGPPAWPAGFAVTEIDGTFRLDGVAPGVTVVAAARVGFMRFDLEDGDSERQRTIVVRPGAETPFVELTLAAADGRVRGRVVDGAGRAVGGATVRAYRGDAPCPGEADLAATALSAPDGRFTLDHLEAEELRLRIAHPAYAEQERADVRPGGPPISFVVGRGAVAAGQVRGHSGAPLEDCTIDLLALPRADDTDDDRAARRARAVREWRRSCGEGGRFELRGVPPGEYDLRVTSIEGMASRRVRLDDGRVDLGAVTVGQGLVVVRGTVTTHEGRGIEGATLLLHSPGWPGSEATTDAEGRFTVPAVPPDPDLRLVATGPDVSVAPRTMTIVADADRPTIDVGIIRLPNPEGVAAGAAAME
jgi:hypothetical protein